jgi:glutathione-specific gamma-glutamylcyclotransferase
MALTRENIRDGTIRRMLEQAGDPRLAMLLSDEARDASLAAMLVDHPAGSDAWVFAYGSLIWNPAIHTVERRMARLHGWHRRYCLWTVLGRGTPDCPGLMLGLERGGSCVGVAWRIAAPAVPVELDILWRREMISGSYVPRWVSLETPDGPLRALTFAINRDHVRYAGRLDDDAVAQVVAQATGPLGTCREYLDNTIGHLRELGIRDSRLERIDAKVAAMKAAATP